MLTTHLFEVVLLAGQNFFRNCLFSAENRHCCVPVVTIFTRMSNLTTNLARKVAVVPGSLFGLLIWLFKVILLLVGFALGLLVALEVIRSVCQNSIASSRCKHLRLRRRCTNSLDFSRLPVNCRTSVYGVLGCVMFPMIVSQR